jgi:hypothetical protein
MALQNKLKAFVRFDGSGRVIPSSLILQKSKPKVGNWKEINATECCNGTPSTTTTTSTFSTTTTTTTAYYYNADYNIGLACGAVGQFNLPLTIAPDVCTSGNIVLNSGTYADYGIPNNSTIYINLNNGNVIQVQTFGSSTMSFGCTSCSGTTTTTTTFYGPFYNADYQFDPVGSVCNGSGQFNIPLQFPTGTCTPGNINLAPGYTWAQFGIGQGVTLEVKDVYTNNIVLINVQLGSAGYNYGCTSSCTTTTTTTGTPIYLVNGTGSFDSINACQSQGTSLSLYYNATTPLGIGTALYYDQTLTSPYSPGVSPSGNGNYLGYGDTVYYISGNVIQSSESCGFTTTTTTTTTA